MKTPSGRALLDSFGTGYSDEMRALLARSVPAIEREAAQQEREHWEPVLRALLEGLAAGRLIDQLVAARAILAEPSE